MAYCGKGVQEERVQGGAESNAPAAVGGARRCASLIL
jgi:hypothetical protein